MNPEEDYPRFSPTSSTNETFIREFRSYAQDAAQFEFADSMPFNHNDDDHSIRPTTTIMAVASTSMDVADVPENLNFNLSNDNDNDRFSLPSPSIESIYSQQSISSSTSNDWIRNNLPLSSQSSSSRSTLMDISNRMNLSISNNPIAKHNRSSYGRNSTSYNRSKTLNTSTISTSGVNVSIHYQSEIVMSIVEGRGKAKGEIGIAFIDLKSIPILKVSQFVDNYSLEALRSKCQVYTPTEIIFPHTMSSNNRMMSTLIESFPEIIYRPFNRKFFNEKRGFDIIRMLAYDDCQWIDLQLDNKYYCLAACSALFHYLIVVRQVSLSFSFDFYKN